GTVTPQVASLGAVLTAAGAGGNVNARALASVGATPQDAVYINASATINNTPANLDGQFGILSETTPGVELGNTNPSRNADFVLYSEDTKIPPNPATLPVVSDD